MSGLHLKLRAKPPGELDASALGGVLWELSAAEVAQLPLPRLGSNQHWCVGDCFEVTARTDRRTVIEGDLRKLHRLACRWAAGELVVEGNVGEGFASQMLSGKVELRGSALAAAAEQMRGGELRISGDVGDELGRPLAGRRSGISGGRIVVAGRAGHRAGYRMRRGTILILGDCGDAAGCDLVAGTIVVGGSTGDDLGAGMRRGTIVVPDGAALSPVRFSRPQKEQLGIARLLATDLVLDAPGIAAALQTDISRAVGDLSAGGMGEIWLFAALKR